MSARNTKAPRPAATPRTTASNENDRTPSAGRASAAMRLGPGAVTKAGVVLSSTCSRSPRGCPEPASGLGRTARAPARASWGHHLRLGGQDGQRAPCFGSPALRSQRNVRRAASLLTKARARDAPRPMSVGSAWPARWPRRRAGVRLARPRGRDDAGVRRGANTRHGTTRARECVVPAIPVASTPVAECLRSVRYAVRITTNSANGNDRGAPDGVGRATALGPLARGHAFSWSVARRCSGRRA